jgi:hypothetical protein
MMHVLGDGAERRTFDLLPIRWRFRDLGRARVASVDLRTRARDFDFRGPLRVL